MATNLRPNEISLGDERVTTRSIDPATVRLGMRRQIHQFRNAAPLHDLPEPAGTESNALMAMPSTATARTRVLEFERVSTDQQELKRQAADLRRNREQHGLETLRVFSVKISGTRVMTHEDVQRMYRELSDVNVDGVSVSAIDRLFRPRDFQQISDVLQFFHANKKVIVSTVEGYVEPWTANGWTTCMTAAMKAGSEWHELKRRCDGGRVSTREEKKACAVNPTYGLQYINKHRADDDGNAQYFIEDTTPTNVAGITRRQIIEMIFDLRYEHKMSPAAIARKITATGVLTPGRKRNDGTWKLKPGIWKAETIRDMLQNRHYCGEHWEAGTLVDCACPIFIERWKFDAVQKMWSAQLGNGRPAATHLLSSFLFCSECGRRLKVYGGEKKRYYCKANETVEVRCSRDLKSIFCHKIEEVVWQTFWKILTQPDLLLRQAERYYESLPKADGLKELRDKVKTLQREIEDTQYMVKKGAYDRKKGVAEIIEAQQQIAQIEAEMRKIGNVVSLPTKKQVEAGLREIADPEAQPETFSDRRPILENVSDFKCTWDGEFVAIEGAIPVPVGNVQKSGSTSI
jgi:hypothetical protein